MAIARDVHGSVHGATDTGKSLALTIASGAVLVAGAYSENSSITATWNGTSMTQIVQLVDVTNGYWLTVWFLGNPTSGAANLVTSVTSTYNNLYGVSYTGAVTTNPTVFDAQKANSGSNLSISATLSTTGNPWYFAMGNGIGMSGTTNATLLDTDNPTFQADFDSNGIAGSNTMTITNSGTNYIGIAAIALQAAAGAATPQVLHNLGLLGVGQ